MYRERYLGPSLIMSSAERRLKSRVSTAPRDFPCPFGFLMPVGAIGRSFTARARWGREHAYGNPPGGLSFLPRLAAAFIRNSRRAVLRDGLDCGLWGEDVPIRG